MKIEKIFKNKKIIVTGHTGFKGSWLTLSLKNLGAKVLGISSNIPTKPSNFLASKINKDSRNIKLNIKKGEKIKKIINSFKPDFIFHLAAEAIVKRAYQNPRCTWETNTMGTINILEALSKIKKKVVAVIVTSDKVYKNLEILRGYHEEDILGGYDPYSASKASADLAVKSYFFSKLQYKKNLKICIARAGNVIGGGDWSEGRLIPDCVKKWSSKKIVYIRNPKSTRPWQHVLDVLNGYINLAVKLKKNKKLNGHAFNFGPKKEKKREVLSIVKEMKKNWDDAKWIVKKNIKLKESNLLQLNSLKAKKLLNWECKLNLKQAIYYTAEWYNTFYKDRKKIIDLTIKQIKKFEKIKNN